MPAMKVVATEEGHYNGRNMMPGQTFVLVDRLLHAIPSGTHKRPESIQTAESQFSDSWMEKVEGAPARELMLAQKVAELEDLTGPAGQAAIAGQAAQGGMMGNSIQEGKEKTAARVLAEQDIKPKSDAKQIKEETTSSPLAGQSGSPKSI